MPAVTKICRHAIVVEVDSVSGPRPAAHLDAHSRAGLLEGPVAAIAIELAQKRQGTAGAQHHQILKAGIAKVHEQRRGGGVQDPDACLIGDAFERAIAPMAVGAIRKPARLADVAMLRHRQWPSTKTHPPPRLS